MKKLRTVAAVVAIISGGETHWFACDFAVLGGKCFVIIADVNYEIFPNQVIVREPERKQSLVNAGMSGDMIVCNRRQVDAAKEADPNSGELLAFLQSQTDVVVEEDPAAPVVALPMLEDTVTSFPDDEAHTVDGEGDSALRALVNEALENWKIYGATPDGRFAYLKQGGKPGQVLLPFVAALLAGNVPVYFIVRFSDLPVELQAAGKDTVFPSDETVAYAIQQLSQHYEKLLEEIARRFTLAEIKAIQQPNNCFIRWQGGITPTKVVELLNSGKKKKRFADGQPSATT